MLRVFCHRFSIERLLHPLVFRAATFPSSFACFRKTTLTKKELWAPTYLHQMVLTVTGTRVGDILDDWNRRKRSFRQDSLARCLYQCLKAASQQQIPSAQLAQIPQFQEFWRHLCNEVQYMSANTAVMCLYNCAKYSFYVDRSFFSDLINVFSKKVDTIPPRAFGILLWSLYKLDLYQHNKALIANILFRLHAELLSGNEVKPQAFANVLWVLASTRTWPKFITASVMKYIPERISDFDFHSLSIVMWAVTTAALKPSDLFLTEVGSKAASLLQNNFDAISLVHCCWAFGSAGFYHEQFFLVLIKKILSEPLHSSFLTPRLLSSVAWSCARTGYYDAQLLDYIAMISLNKINSFNSQDLGNLAYCYGYLNHSSDTLLLTISHIMSSQPEMAANELACANVANSCLIHKLYPETLLGQLLSYERVAALIERRDEKHLHFCVQVHSILQVERPDLKHCILQPPQDKIVTALVLANAIVQCRRVYSIFHRNICKALLQITGSSQKFVKEALTTCCYFIDAEIILDNDGIPLTIPSEWEGWRQPKQLLSKLYPQRENPILWDAINTAVAMDATVAEGVSVASDWNIVQGDNPVMARKIAIEADGPKHYAVNCRHKLGNTILKHRTLRAQGWDVVDIPYFEWQNLESDQDHIHYIQRTLKL